MICRHLRITPKRKWGSKDWAQGKMIRIGAPSEPTGMSEAGMTLQRFPKLRQGCWVLRPLPWPVSFRLTLRRSKPGQGILLQPRAIQCTALAFSCGVTYALLGSARHICVVYQPQLPLQWCTLCHFITICMFKIFHTYSNLSIKKREKQPSNL